MAEITLPETNTWPLKIGHPEKSQIIFQPSIFRGKLAGFVSGKGIYLWLAVRPPFVEVKALGGCRAFSVDYPKPPDSPFPAALENATW